MTNFTKVGTMLRTERSRLVGNWFRVEVVLWIVRTMLRYCYWISPAKSSLFFQSFQIQLKILRSLKSQVFRKESI